MSAWINLNEAAPKKTEGFVLACDWHPGDKEEDIRFAICELPAFDAYWCGIKKGVAMNVFKSICPCIGHGHNAHWMEIPADDWIKFDAQSYPYRELHEVLIKLHNGNCYVGFIELAGLWQDWCPSFNMMKHGSIEDIEYYRELPKAPVYIPEPELTEEEKKIEKEFMESMRPTIG